MSETKPERTEGPYRFNKSFLEISKEGDLFWIAKVNAPNRPENECRELGIDLVDKLNSHDALVAENERLVEALESVRDCTLAFPERYESHCRAVAESALRTVGEGPNE